MRKVYSFNKIFTGTEWLHNQVVIINNNIIEAVRPLQNSDNEPGHINYNDYLLMPSFIDVQVYGAADRLLSAYPDMETLEVMNSEFLKRGTILFMPTVATNTLAIFKKCIDAVRDYWKNGGKGVHGIHLEGPWINPEKKGAHLEECIHSPTENEVKELLEYGKDIIKMITIAPEMCSDEVIELIRSYNITISAGHSNASYQQATESFNKGINTVTHLYNAMSPLHHREPGMVGSVLDHETVRSSIVPDGYHVDYAALRIAKKMMGNRLFAITDAVTETKMGPYQHHLSGNKYESNGILSGSALCMYQAFLNLVQYAGIGIDEAHRMCSLYPAEILKQDNKYGKIAPGYIAQFVVLNNDLELKEIITC
ncbi:MAG TPA: N-acetylglucosamine-6-phosphate deacetylase [Flavisolibacter sp.]|nr:N-acetylglucosamine-6-phosphate deacetylase [Flavisolibacter sp.]